jgi:hypothetical protein
MIGGMAQALPNKQEALHSNLVPPKNKRERKEKKKKAERTLCRVSWPVQEIWLSLIS